jgi:nucleoid-associated protein YgaU
VGAQTYFPEPYERANTAYTEAGTAQSGKRYDDALAAANRIIAAVDEIEKLKAQRDAGSAAGAVAAADLEAAERQRAEEEAALRLAEEEAARQRAQEAARAVNAAGERLDWAASVGANVQFPGAYNEAAASYGRAQEALDGQDWDTAISQAAAVLTALEGVREVSPLPARYTVRTWQGDRDCLWNIAGYPWVYNDPWQWRRLYEANRSKLVDDANPDLILPEMVLDIPSFRGEVREGEWDPNRQYEPLP